jgi:hypothetical protein
MLTAGLRVLEAKEVFHHLEKTFPPNWKATETLVVRMTFDEAGQRLLFNLTDAEVFENVQTKDDLRLFLPQLANGGTTPNGRRPPDPGVPSPLGVAVRNPTNLIVVLDDASWQFRSTGPAVTAKADKQGDNYGSWHVDRNGVLLDDTPAGCRIACFLVARRADNDVVQKFNFHLSLLQGGGRWLEIIIDPDVPETGTEGFP